MIMEMNSMNMIRYHALLNTYHFLGGNGLKNFCEPIYDSLRRCLWEKAGWLISAAGSEDDKITQEGSATYQVWPRFKYVAVTAAILAPTIINIKLKRQDNSREDTGDDIIVHDNNQNND